jgi:Icc-related predicted phosphoesterase
MRIVCISDTHTAHNIMTYPIPDGDVLVHAGDFTNIGHYQDVVDFNEWIRKFPHAHKVVVAGNHDICFTIDRELAKAYLFDCTYLQDSSVVIDGFLFYGSPWQPRFYEWAFNADRGPDLAEKWARIPEDVDVLITHSPPKGIGDISSRGNRFGCEDLLQRVIHLNPLLHIYGHNHEGYGKREVGGTIFVNCSICTKDYHPTNTPIVVDI